MTDLTVKFDGGRMAVLGPDNRIVGHIGEWLHHHDERIKEQAWEEGARAMTGSHAAQIMRIIEDAMRAANPYTPANKKDAPADEPDHDMVPLSDRRETAWRIRHPDVARSHLYDMGWQDALMNLDQRERDRLPEALPDNRIEYGRRTYAPVEELDATRAEIQRVRDLADEWERNGVDLMSDEAASALRHACGTRAGR